MVYAATEVKGGVGKTTFSNHILPFLTDSKIVVEIDNSNFSSIYSESKLIKGISLSTAQKEIERAIDEAEFVSDEHGVIIDAGGGDDSLKVIEALKKSGIECEFYLPLAPDFETLAGLEKTLNTIGGNGKVHLVLSRFDSRNLEGDYWFIYGSEEYGVAGNTAILDKFDSIIKVPNTNLMSLAKAMKTTIWDLSLISQSYDFESIKQEWKKEGREIFFSKMASHRLSISCHEYLEEVKDGIQIQQTKKSKK